MTFRYDFAPTPFGDALAVFSDEGIVRFDLSESEDPSVPWLLEGVSRQLHAVPEPDPGAADELAHLLSDYFDGRPVRFEEHLRLDWRLVEGFPLTALQTICSIEWGQTMSYGEVAVVAGASRCGARGRHGLPPDAVLDHRARASGGPVRRHPGALRRAPGTQEVPSRSRGRLTSPDARRGPGE